MMESSTAHWSIGEVLGLLQDEFPDVTISKIRFLESQGLIDPERTPSGYRRFYDRDFERLRWILVQQRDHYLPLKVIRDRLEAGDVVGLDSGDDIEVLPDDAELSVLSDSQSFEAADIDPLLDLTDDAVVPVGDLELATSEIEEVTLVVPGEVPERSAVAEASISQADVETDSLLQVEGSGMLALVAMSRDELAEAAGCDQRLLHELERFNLIAGRSVGSVLMFDAAALEVARLAVRFGEFGLDPRHLRSFRLGAEREVGLVAQIVQPMMHRRSPDARQETMAILDEMMALATSLRNAMVRHVVAEQFPDR